MSPMKNASKATKSLGQNRVFKEGLGAGLVGAGTVAGWFNQREKNDRARFER